MNKYTTMMEEITKRKIKKYGWIHSIPDARDIKYAFRRSALSKPLPSEVDLRPDMPPVYNQHQTSSCTGNMAAAMYQYALKQAGMKDMTPSRLFIYYNERLIEGTANQDGGAQIRDGLKAMNLFGVCSEETWEFDEHAVTKKPTENAYKEAKNNVIHNYASLDNTNLNALKQCLAHKFPIGFGFAVYTAFESEEVARTGILKMPDLQKENIIGAHATILCGYNSNRNVFYGRNSWGKEWGLEGYFEIPFDYIINPQYAADFWMLRLTPNK